MAKNSSVNLDITNNSDGFDVSGGTTKRKLSVTGADVTVTGTGSFTYTYPEETCTLAKARPVQTDVTVSRAVNTTYTNGSAVRSIMVMATFRCAVTVAAGNAYAQAKSDSSTPPTTVVSGIVGIEAGVLNENVSVQVCFIIAPSMKYRIDTSVTNGTCVLGKWMEVSF